MNNIVEVVALNEVSFIRKCSKDSNRLDRFIKIHTRPIGGSLLYLYSLLCSIRFDKS